VPQYYFGDPNSANVKDFENPDFRHTLPTLSFNPGMKDWTSLKSIQGHEREFGDYYRSIIETAYKHGHNYNSFRQHFWTRRIIDSQQAKSTIGFPWYDHADDFSRFDQWVLGGQDDDQFWDGEQGWQLAGWIKDGRIYFLMADDLLDWEDPNLNIVSNFAMDLKPLQKSLSTERGEVKNVIGKLTDHLGVDVWTKYHYKERLNFGTKDWNPKE